MSQSDNGKKVLSGIAIVALIATAFMAFFFGGKVCEQQLTQAGKIVDVCRHLQGTDLPVLAGAALLLLALGTFFPEVGAFGFSIKSHVAEAKTSADNAKAASESATRAAELAEEVSRKAAEFSAVARGAEQTVNRAEQLFTQLAISQQGPPSTTNVDVSIRELAAEYNDIRKSLRSSGIRTERMTNVVARMTVVANAHGPHEVDVAPWLSSEDSGLRLAAYAFLHTHPVPALTPLLAQTALNEDKQLFGQYWALRALRRQVSLDPESLDLHTRRRLEALLASIGPSTDRGYELTQILADRRDKSTGE